MRRENGLGERKPGGEGVKKDGALNKAQTS